MMLLLILGSYILGFKLMARYFNYGMRLGGDIPNGLTMAHKSSYESPLIVFTCQRASYLRTTLTDILKYIPRPCTFGCPVIVSQDGENSDVEAVVSEFQKEFASIGIPLIHINHKRALKGAEGAYQALSNHYGWAFSQVFNGRINANLPMPQRIIVLEEDLHIAPDFFGYMAETSKILDKDSTLFAVSAFNDNGHLVNNPERVLRSDFFPGLGWMMKRSLWKSELEAKWPEGYWDDWLREPAQRKGRQILRPEFSRTYHFGFHGGASKNQFGSILRRVRLCEEFVDWAKVDLSYLEERAYAKLYLSLLDHSVHAQSIKEARRALKRNKNVVVEYSDFDEFKVLARKLDIMDDEKAMVPRTGYKGIVEVRPFEGSLLFLRPSI
ncbi:unnamed protein product [Cylindrotheca closterium]|uniref:alpha-1,3-mannosyl-glycoprotein 2-beta-N-acetylglucosaminyltransferase n=1 Tax=Cylindrotheca closterium TaxID=2856 RepID=A0AAD2FDF0_9STRA|nr:unnamed protein product [Cylindrotheca closterium]